MLHRIPTRSRLAAGVAAAILGAAALAWAAPADDLREAQKLYQQGRMQPALEKVETVLRAQPKDPQGRFLKGILLTEMKRTPEAIQVFTGLTEDFPFAHMWTWARILRQADGPDEVHTEAVAKFELSKHMAPREKK